MASRRLADHPSIRLAGPGELVRAIPHLLGFVPQRSLVLVGLGADRRVTLTARIDLPERPEDTEAVITATVAAMSRTRPDQVVAVVVADVPGPVGVDDRLPHLDLVEALIRECDRLGLWLADCLLQSGDRWWSYGCVEPGCCPVGGTPLTDTPTLGDLAAAQTLAGRGVLADRDSVLAQLTSPDPPTAARMAVALRAAEAVPVETDPGRRRGLASSRLDQALADLADPRHEPADATVAELVVCWRDVPSRDDAMARAAAVDAVTGLRRLLLAMAGRCPSPEDVAVCAVLGWVALLDGDSVLAGAACERSLASDPSYSLALLLDQALAAVVAPDAVRRVLTSLE